MEEIWKPVVGYEGLYEVSHMSSVRSLRSNVILKHMEIKSNPLKYEVVALYKNGKYKRFLVHRLVALAFNPNPGNKPFVDHIDGDVHNNRADNLRWCTAKENRNNPITSERCAKARRGYKFSDDYKKRMSESLKGKYTGSKHWLSKKVIQFSKDGEFIKVWDSAKDIERKLGYRGNNICDACNGKYAYAYGYIWKYYSSNLVGEKVQPPKLKKEKKRVCQLSASGDIIKVFDSVEDARRYMGLKGPYIGLCCRGKGKSAGGYQWRYANENE